MPRTGKKTTGRLQKRSDFLRANAGRKWVSPSVIVQTAEAHSEQDIVRTGFTATKKLGGAVVRNRIKRRLRAAARDVLQHAQTPCDLVFIGRAATVDCPYQSLLKDMRWCLKRLEITGHEKVSDHAT